MDKLITPLYNAGAVPMSIFIFIMLISFIYKKLASKYNPSVKVLRISALLALYGDYILLSIVCIFISFGLYMIIGIILVIIATGILNLYLSELDYKYILAFLICILMLLQNIVSRKSKSILSLFIQSLTCRKILSQTIFSLPKLLFSIFCISSLFVENNYYSYIGALVFFIILLVGSVYFSAFKFYNKCSNVRIVFKNSMSDIICKYEDYSRQDGFILIEFRDENGDMVKTIAYNQNDISYIELIVNNTDMQYLEYLKRRGFSE